ncbi:helix-turn-helix domain-containing protein [Isoalcanivorax indicus]|uniref:helix-turn-helix domain-containing protein n=1 Tax=Isoalcanivorax indicus TaxID=2202653 RepID=UPI000DB9F837|nr:helix-turn-helix domain-containing protein [Isoalcanivorax indicus]
MFHTFRVPGAPLSRYISALWISSSATLPHQRERLLPDGSINLVIPLTDHPPTLYAGPHGTERHRFSGPLVCGIHTHDITIDTATQQHVMGVMFQPGGSLPFFGISSRLLHNSALALDDLWGQDGIDMYHQLRGAANDASRFRILEQCLQRRLLTTPHPVVNAAVNRLTLQPGQRISPLADELGLSQRRFQQVFTDAVGVPPKVFARLQRLRLLLCHTANATTADWSALALEVGYYDQAHLIREFRALTNMTPEAFLRSERRLLNHLPVASSASATIHAA